MDSQEFQQWTDKLPPQERQVVRSLVSTSVVKSFVLALSDELSGKLLATALNVENHLQCTPVMQIVAITRRSLDISIGPIGQAFGHFYTRNPSIGQQVLWALSMHDRDLLRKFISE